jgi:hypothetical protein
MSNYNKLKLMPLVEISKGGSKSGSVTHSKESRKYGIKGTYDLYDKKNTKISLEGSYKKSSGKDKFKTPSGEFVFEGESKPEKFIGIKISKKFDKGGYSEQDFPKYFKSGKKKPKPSLSEEEKDTGAYDYGFDKDIDIVEIPTFKRGGDNMPARNKKNFRPTEKGAGMTSAGVAAYRRANPGSKLKTAVTGKVKPGSKAAKRRKSFCARSAGQMKKFPKAAKDPNSRLRQARRRWKC